MLALSFFADKRAGCAITFPFYFEQKLLKNTVLSF